MATTTIYGTDNIDVYGGTPDDDLILGATAVDGSGDVDPDTLSGGDGNDTILGFANDDRLYGGTGSDTLEGGDDVCAPSPC